MAIESGSVSSQEFASHKTEVASLRSPYARQKAADLAKEGQPIGSYNRGVCAIWGDGANPEFPATVAKIKGELRGNRPLAASLSTERFVEMLDLSKVPPSLHDTFLNAKKLADATGSLCFFRAPITDAAARTLPPSMVSEIDGVKIIQNWDAKGHRPTHKLLRAFEHEGIEFPAVTSMNVSGEPEITSQQQGIEFSQVRGIPMFLEDPKDPHRAVGSYTILGLSDSGLQLVREGNIPSEVIQKLLGVEIDTSDHTVAKSMKPLSFDSTRLEGVDPRFARIAILSSLQDRPETITKAVLHTGRLLGRS
jgi:hypothetical protein